MWVVAKRMKNSDVPAVSAYLASLPLPEQVQPIELSALPNQLPGWCVRGRRGQIMMKRWSLLLIFVV